MHDLSRIWHTRAAVISLLVVFSCGVGETQSSLDREIDYSKDDLLFESGLTADEIMAVIRDGTPTIRDCYENQLARSPGAAGKINVKFLINSFGRIVYAETPRVDPGLDEEMIDGLLETLWTWQFPIPRNAATITVNYPLVFNPEPGDPKPD